MIKSKNIIVITCLFSLAVNISHGEDTPFRYDLPRKSNLSSTYENIKDPAQKKIFEDRLIKECPFKKKESEFDVLSTDALNLRTSASVTDAKMEQCKAQLKDFNDSIAKTKEFQTKIQNTQTKLTEEEEKSIAAGFASTQVAASAFNNILQSGCELKNNSRTIANIGNQLINLLDVGSSILAFTVPQAALVAAGAAITGRLVISLSKWIFENDKDQVLAKEATDSKRYINDLCLFRSLAYKYDELYVDPLQDPELELLRRQNEKEQSTALADKMRQCVNRPADDPLSKLNAFYKEISTAVGLIASPPPAAGAVNVVGNPQTKCADLIKRYNASKNSDQPHLKNLAATYGCPSPRPGSDENVVAFCDTWTSLEAASQSGFYSKCEQEDFQKSVAAKFTTISDLLFQAIQDQEKAMAPHPDDLARLRELEKHERLSTQRFASLEAILKDSPIARANAAKAMAALGHTVLGKRFNDFKSDSIKSASNNLNEAKSSLSKLVRYKKKIDKIKDPVKKSKQQQQLCTGMSEVRNKLGITYDLSLGLDETCEFMSGSGIPALKSKGPTFDSYSKNSAKKFWFFKTEKTLTERCNDIKTKTSSFVNEVVRLRETTEQLGCGR